MAGMVRQFIVLACAGLLTACGVQEAFEDAEQEIGTFHHQLDSESYAAIHAATAAQFREASTEEDFSRLLEAIHTKLGAVVSSKQANWAANTNNGVSTVTVVMETEFEQGSGTETFVYLWEDEGLDLLSYNINSTDMMVN